MIRRSFALLPLVLALVASACSGPETGLPPVQHSAKAAPRSGLVISLNRIISGHYRTIAPFCVGQRYRISVDGVEAAAGLPIRPGDTAEFRNYMPELPANVTSVDVAKAPAPMFSPNLRAPYNLRTEGGESFSFWRFTFPVAGVYEWFDTNMGEPGRKIVDSYYGTVTFVGESNAPKGVVCVDEPGCVASLECLNGTAPAGTNCCNCPGVCCDADTQCSSGLSCLRGRCVDPATIE